MAQRPLGLALVVVGLVIVVLGVFAWLGWLSWFGRLPGDVRIVRPGFRFHAPIVSMLLISIVLSVLVALLRKWWP
jgi:hypothetical protein